MRCLLVLPLLLVAACTTPAPEPLSPAEAGERDSVLAVLRTLDSEALDLAFARLGDASAPYLTETRVEQLGTDGAPVAFRTRTLRIGPRRTTLVAADSSGTFDYGAFDVVAGSDAWEDSPGLNPVALTLPEEPAWLDPRGREAFRFGIAPDTLLGDRRVRVLTVEARPGEGDDQPLRRARLYLDSETSTLVGFRLHRRLASVLFGETSEALVLLHPGPDGWRPHRTRFETALDAPLATRRRFHLTRRYTFPTDAPGS